MSPYCRQHRLLKALAAVDTLPPRAEDGEEGENTGEGAINKAKKRQFSYRHFMWEGGQANIVLESFPIASAQIFSLMPAVASLPSCSNQDEDLSCICGDQSMPGDNTDAVRAVTAESSFVRDSQFGKCLTGD